jgi:hypothetical protein
MKKIKSIVQWILKPLYRGESHHVSTLPSTNGISRKYATIDMPMRVFINALCDKDYSEVENFDAVLIEFTESIGGDELKRIIQEKKDIELKKLRYLSALNLIQLLNIRYSESNFTQLKDLDYHVFVAGADLEDYEKYISQIDGWVKRDEMDFRKLADEMKANEALPKQQVEYTRDYFAAMYLAFMESLKVTLTEETPARIYCQCAKRYKQYCEFMNKQQKSL